jgi:AraC family transcriptional regulator of adaptative response/methylated-DNA-[protein]-cysteine methyltransferase
MDLEHVRSGQTMTTRQSRARAVEADPRWVAVRHRDREADGTFVYAVTTTGVYCRPSCGARLPRPENVRFFARGNDAVRAGFRACKRCRADAPPLAERQATQVAALCRMIEAREDVPSLDELAATIGASRFHTQRMFKRITSRRGSTRPRIGPSACATSCARAHR